MVFRMTEQHASGVAEVVAQPQPAYDAVLFEIGGNLT
jgi:hypothetical protein